ncbi:MAG: VWA domain-containing protein, partial [Gramella sp.]|nr:VWA domain-containing protein [Christiangramia sp.]
MLLINPKVRSIDYEIDKPELIVLADNSQSVPFLGEADKLRDLSASLAGNSQIQKKFNVNSLYFGEEVSLEDSLKFHAEQTDIYAALSETEDLFTNERSA